MIQAVLGNPSHPEYGVATIPFPIPHNQYAHCMELLEALEVGDAVKADCRVEKIDSFYTVLKRTEMRTVNVEELNYLAKRLDSFDTGEAAQFQAMAHKLELFELKDLINLTFCCQQATVITDFSNLDAVGRDHYMNLHGGSASVDELNVLDGKKTARQLIENGGGTITPYGVVYDNGMKLEPVYDGRFFPCYYYEPNAITVAVTSKAEPEDTKHITWLFLPMVQEEIDRALQRAGITDPEDVRLRMEDTQLPDEVDVLLDMEQESLADLNALAQAADALSTDDMKKLGAVVTMAKPQNAEQVKNLAENTATVTDDNEVLGDYNFAANSGSGITFTRKGDTLTITATAAAAKNLDTEKPYSATGSAYEIDPDRAVICWYDRTGRYQAMAGYTGVGRDPVKAYIKIMAVEEKGSITIRKVDVTGSPLTGAELLLETSAGGKTWTEVGRVTTDKTGIAKWSDLKTGAQYRVTETKAPAGYTLLTEPLFTGALDSSNRDITITACNNVGFALPFTGGMGFTTYILLAALMLCMGVYFCKKSNIKKEKTK